MRPLQYVSNSVYEITILCLYVSTIHVYTVRHNVMCICHAQGPIGLYLRNKHSSSSVIFIKNNNKKHVKCVLNCTKFAFNIIKMGAQGYVSEVLSGQPS